MRFAPLIAVALLVGACSQSPVPRAAAPPATVAPAPAATVAPAPILVEQPRIEQPFPHEESVLRPDPAVRWGKLPNGVRYALMHSAQPPGRVSLRVRMDAGSLFEDEDQRGLAHFLEHMAFNGTKHFPPGVLIPTLQKVGIGFGNHLNAHTSYDETVYKLDLPDTKPETLDLGLTAMVDQAGGLLLDPKEVLAERGVILSELRDHDGPEMRIDTRSMALLFDGTRIPLRRTIGEAEVISKATDAELRRYYERWYRPERMIVAIVGDVDLDDTEARLRRMFEAAAAIAPYQAPPAIGTLSPGQFCLAVAESEADGTSVQLCLLRQRVQPPDSANVRCEQFLRDLGESILARRIHKLVESDAQCPLLNGGGFSYQWLDHYLAGAQGTAKPGRALDALRFVTIEYKRMIEHGPTAAEIEVEAANVRAGLDTAITQAASRPNSALASALYNSIADRKVFRSPEQSRELGLALLAQATPESIRAVFRDIRSGAVRTTAMVSGKESLGADGDRLVTEAFNAAWSAAVAAPVTHATATWGYAVTTTYTGAVPARDTSAEWAFGNANGISLIAKRTDFQPGRVLVRVRLPIRTGPRQPGMSELVRMGLTSGGLGKHSASELSEVLAGTTASVGGIGIEDGALVIDGGCRPDHLQKTLELIRAWLTDAGWRSEAETRAKTAWIESLEAEKTDVEAMTWRRVSELTYATQPWRGSADRAAAEAATFASARTWLEPLLRDAPISVSIVGDVDEEAALRMAANVLGTTTRPAVTTYATPELARAAQPENPTMPTGEHRFEVNGKVGKAQIVVMWPTDDQYDVVRSRRLSLLSGVFSEKIRDLVREKFGDAYSPYARVSVGDDWRGQGMLMTVISVAPDRADAARDAALQVAAEISSGISADLLDRVRTPIVKSISERRRQNGWWLTIVARAAEQPFRLEWPATLEKDFNDTTADDLVALAKTYLVPDKALIVIGVSKGQDK